MFDIEFNGTTGRSHRVLVQTRPAPPAPQEKIEEYTVSGRDGVLLERTGAYENIELPVQLNFSGRNRMWGEIYRGVKRWLTAPGINRLRFSDDADYFYKVEYVSISDTEREARMIGRVTANFICQPYQYAISGDAEYGADDVLYNTYDISKPEYRITGEGVCALTVNGNKTTINVGQNVTIDTDRMMAYRTDGELMNTSVTGDYAGLFLLPGQNTIAITSGFTLKVIPHWRTL